MSNVRFILDNTSIDSADLSTSTGDIDTGYPVENIQKINRSMPLRTTATTNDLVIKGTLAAPSNVSALVIGRHNFSETITYRLYLYANDDWTGTPLYDSTELLVTAEQASVLGLYQWGEFAWGTIAWGADKPDLDNREFYDIVLWFADKDTPYTIQSYTIEVKVAGGIPINPFWCDESLIFCDDTSITCDMLAYGPTGEIGRVYLGEYIEPTYNLSAGHAISWKENTTQYRPSSGTLRSDKVTSNKSFEFSLKHIPEADRRVLHKQLIAKGLREDFYLSLFPENASNTKEIDYSGMVKMTKIPKYTNYINGYFKSSFVMEEI
jgi:hypothetical protein